MDEPKLIIEPKKYGGETSVISLRLPKDMLADIDAIARETGRTRNEMLMLFLDFSLSHSEIVTPLSAPADGDE